MNLQPLLSLSTKMILIQRVVMNSRCVGLGLFGNSFIISCSSNPGDMLARAITRPVGLFYFVPILLLYILILYCLPSFSVSVSYFSRTFPYDRAAECEWSQV